MIEVDGLDTLIADLAESPRRIQVHALHAVSDAARDGAEDARRFAPRRYLPHYAATITHEAEWVRGAAVSEFGPERRGQGNLGAILEEGTAKTPPHAHVGPAFDRQQPAFIAALEHFDPL